MTALDYVGRQIRWLAGLFAGVDLVVSAIVALLRIPAADPMATWLMGSAAAGLTFAFLTMAGFGLQYAGRLLAGGAHVGRVGRSSSSPWR